MLTTWYDQFSWGLTFWTLEGLMDLRSNKVDYWLSCINTKQQPVRFMSACEAKGSYWKYKILKIKVEENSKLVGQWLTL